MGGSPDGRFFIFVSWKSKSSHQMETNWFSWFHGAQWSIHHFKCLSFKDGAVQILAFCHWQRSSLSHRTSSLLWQVSIQTEADLDPLPGAQGSLCSNRNYTFAPSPALSSWHHKTTPGAAAPHHETSNFVGIIGHPGFRDEHHLSVNLNYPGLSLKALMFRSSWLLESSPSSSLSAILVRMQQDIINLYRFIPESCHGTKYGSAVDYTSHKMQMEKLQHVANAPWRNMTWHDATMLC